MLALSLGAEGSEQTVDELTRLPIEQLLDMPVYSASKFDQKMSEAPSAVSVVTAQEIRDFGYRSLADILKSVRGLYVTYDRNYSYLGVRGFSRPGDYNTRVLLLLNGYRINDNVYDQAFIGNEFPVDVDLIERVEFVPGPGSAVYGTNAFFGVINVITKKGVDISGVQAAAEIGGSDRRGGRLTYGRRSASGVDVLLSLSGLNDRGHDLHFAEFDHAETNFGVAHDLDYDRKKTLFARGRI